MKLVHKNIELPINFSNNSNQLLVIENPKEFYNLTNQLYNQIELNKNGEWVLSKNNSVIDLNKNMLFCSNYFDFAFENKKVENLINNSILKHFKSQDFIEEFASLNIKMAELNNKIMQEIDLPIEHTGELIFEDFIKISKYKISSQSDLINNLITFVDIAIKLKNIKIMVFINLFSYISFEEIKALLKQFEYMQINVLFIESTLKHKINELNTVVIDKDLCII